VEGGVGTAMRTGSEGGAAGATAGPAFRTAAGGEAADRAAARLPFWPLRFAISISLPFLSRGGYEGVAAGGSEPSEKRSDHRAGGWHLAA